MCCRKRPGADAHVDPVAPQRLGCRAALLLVAGAQNDDVAPRTELAAHLETDPSVCSGHERHWTHWLCRSAAGFLKQPGVAGLVQCLEPHLRDLPPAVVLGERKDVMAGDHPVVTAGGALEIMVTAHVTLRDRARIRYLETLRSSRLLFVSAPRRRRESCNRLPRSRPTARVARSSGVGRWCAGPA